MSKHFEESILDYNIFEEVKPTSYNNDSSPILWEGKPSQNFRFFRTENQGEILAVFIGKLLLLGIPVLIMYILINYSSHVKNGTDGDLIILLYLIAFSPSLFFDFRYFFSRLNSYYKITKSGVIFNHGIFKKKEIFLHWNQIEEGIILSQSRTIYLVLKKKHNQYKLPKRVNYLSLRHFPKIETDSQTKFNQLKTVLRKQKVELRRIQSSIA